MIKCFLELPNAPSRISHWRCGSVCPTSQAGTKQAFGYPRATTSFVEPACRILHRDYGTQAPNQGRGQGPGCSCALPRYHQRVLLRALRLEMVWSTRACQERCRPAWGTVVMAARNSSSASFVVGSRARVLCLGMPQEPHFHFTARNHRRGL